MTKLAEIQEAIRGLAPQEQQALRHWLDETAEETPEMLKIEQEDPALQAALQRKQDSLSGQGTSRPYQEAIASVRAGLAQPHANRPATGS